MDETLKEPPAPGSQDDILGHFPHAFDERHENPSTASFDENALIAELFESGRAPGVMVDVGAHLGGSAQPFLEMGWTVLGVEPDRTKHETLRSLVEGGAFKLVTCAAGDGKTRRASLYTSEESDGITSLVAFRESHQRQRSVPVRTLTKILRKQGIDRTDYLKIDAEGYDLRVLQGFPFLTHRPRVIMCEFEDAKTKNVGYTTHDLGKHLLQHGYSVYLSEWDPITRYGVPHVWRSIRKYPCELDDPGGWGNFIAVQPGEMESRFVGLIERVRS